MLLNLQKCWYKTNQFANGACKNDLVSFLETTCSVTQCATELETVQHQQLVFPWLLSLVWHHGIAGRSSGGRAVSICWTKSHKNYHIGHLLKNAKKKGLFLHFPDSVLLHTNNDRFLPEAKVEIARHRKIWLCTVHFPSPTPTQCWRLFNNDDQSLRHNQTVFVPKLNQVSTIEVTNQKKSKK